MDGGDFRIPSPGNGMDRQFAKAPAKTLVLIVGQMLIAEENHQVFHQRIVHFLELLIAERARQIDPADLRADMRRQLFDLDRLVRHSPLPLGPQTIACDQASERTIRAGLPAASVPGGRSRVTTLPAPTTQPSPIVTPGKTIAPPPIHTPLPMRIGFAASQPAARLARSSGW